MDLLERISELQKAIGLEIDLCIKDNKTLTEDELDGLLHQLRKMASDNYGNQVKLLEKYGPHCLKK